MLAESNSKGAISEMETAEDLLIRGEQLGAEGQWEEARACYQKAVKLDPKNWKAYHLLGDACLNLEQYEKAVKCYRNCLKLNPDFTWAYHNLGVALFYLGKPEEAFNLHQKVTEIKPDFWKLNPVNFQIQHQIGDFWFEQEDLEKAIIAYRRAIELNFNSHWSHCNISRVFQKANQLEKAILSIKTALEVNPEFAYAYYYLGCFLTEGKRYQEAIEALNKALEIQPNSSEFKVYINQILLQEKNDLNKIEEQGKHKIKEVKIDNYENNYKIIENSCFFNLKFYLTQRPEISGQYVDEISHYINQGSFEGNNPNPIFDSLYYLEQNPDIVKSGMNPLAHYISFGMLEGRVAWSVDKVATIMKADSSESSQTQCMSYLSQEASRSLSHDSDLKIGIYCSSIGNYFMTEIADLIAKSLEKIGIIAIRLSESEHNHPTLDYNIIVAPHEFFYLGEGQSWRDFPELSRSVMINVEQPHTGWFSKSLHFLQKAAVVFDINLKSAAILEQLGLNAYYLPLGYLADDSGFESSVQLPDTIALKGLPQSMKTHIPNIDESLENRPIDVHFIGALNQRREQFFARSASWLSQHRCFLHIPPVDRPLIQGQDWMLDTQAVMGLSRLSKILLNVHREETPYFEWHRIVFHGLWQKTLVVTEPCHEVPGLISGEHYIECEANEMADKIHWLLNTPAGIEKAEQVRLRGYEALKNYLSLSQVMEKALGLIAEFCTSEKEVNHND